MDILITGRTGLLGMECMDAFQSMGRVHGFDRKELDITDPQAVMDCVQRLKPAWIVNCAAFTNVDRCETEAGAAFEVNASGPQNLALAVIRHGGRLMHVSSDYVFDGALPPPAAYDENSAPNPISVYGRSKLAGEDAVRKSGAPHVIIRTAWLYGLHGGNFLKTILRLCLEAPGTPRAVVGDQTGCPTWARTLARQMEALAETGAHGTFHAVSHGCAAWFELAEFFLDAMGVPHKLTPCTSDAYKRPAPRPANSILKNERLQKLALDRMNDWKTDVKAFVRDCGDALLKEALDTSAAT